MTWAEFRHISLNMAPSYRIMERMETGDLRMFLHLVESGGLAATSRGLKTPKTSVSRSLGRLEAEIGLPLFDRTARKFRLTDAGALLKPYAASVVHQLEEAASVLEGYAGEPRGTLRVITTPAFAYGLVAPMLSGYLNRFPDVSVQLEADPRNVDLLKNDVDLVITVGPLADSAVIAKQLPPIELFLCASPAYLESTGAPKTIEDLVKFRFIGREKPSKWLFHNGSKHVTIEPNICAVIPDAAAQRVVIEGGGVIGCLPSYVALPGLEAGSLVRLLPNWRRDPIEIHAVYLSHRGMSAKLRTFIDALVTHLKRTAIPIAP